MEFHDTTHTGELTSRMGSDIQELGLLLGNYFGAGIINLVQTVGSLGVALVFSPPVADDVHLADAHGVHSPTAVADHGDHLLQRPAREEAQSHHQGQSRPDDHLSRGKNRKYSHREVVQPGGSPAGVSPRNDASISTIRRKTRCFLTTTISVPEFAPLSAQASVSL